MKIYLVKGTIQKTIVFSKNGHLEFYEHKLCNLTIGI